MQGQGIDGRDADVQGVRAGAPRTAAAGPSRREVPGRLDVHRVDRLRRDLLTDGGATVELDLGATSFIDMAGIELLEALGEGRDGRPDVTVTALSQPVRIILELAATCGLVRSALPAPDVPSHPGHGDHGDRPGSGR